MLGGLLNLRLKAAEQALRDKRLDEAFRVVEQKDIRNQRRGARLVTELAQAFLERARQHYRAERFTEALLDLNKADTCGGLEDKVAELRRQVLTVADEVARKEAERRGRIEEARRRMHGGSLSAGRKILERAKDDDPAAKELAKELGSREQRAGELLDQAEALIKQGRLAGAVERLAHARELHAHNDRLFRLETFVGEKAAAAAVEAFRAGRLTKAQAELEVIEAMGEQCPQRAEVLDMLQLARSAGRRLADGQYEEAERQVRRLQRLCPKTRWIDEAAQHLATMDKVMLALRGGPLGDAVSQTAREIDAGLDTGGRVNIEETVLLPGKGQRLEGAPSLPDRMLLLVDGGGSYLLHRGGRLSIGRAMSSDPADVPILSDLAERHAEIARVEEDYFVLSPHEVEVSGRRTRHQLLRDGDRVVLARRAKFKFRVPNRKSPSGLIDLSASTKMPNDVRQVVLFRQAAMIGRGSTCHIVCREAGRDFVLFERAGRLWVRPQGRHADSGDTRPVEIGRRVEIDGLSFVIQPWTMRMPGSGPLA